ncbi:hypothetical protein DFH09DRAFT_1399488 [Mycena vulgaris]|nr:hypothetical protein DFH09DRAFT_1399488 [Mycena vulgaris]
MPTGVFSSNNGYNGAAVRRFDAPDRETPAAVETKPVFAPIKPARHRHPPCGPGPAPASTLSRPLAACTPALSSPPFPKTSKSISISTNRMAVLPLLPVLPGLSRTAPFAAIPPLPLLAAVALAARLVWWLPRLPFPFLNSSAAHLRAHGRAVRARLLPALLRSSPWACAPRFLGFGLGLGQGRRAKSLGPVLRMRAPAATQPLVLLN